MSGNCIGPEAMDSIIKEPLGNKTRMGLLEVRSDGAMSVAASDAVTSVSVAPLSAIGSRGGDDDGFMRRARML